MVLAGGLEPQWFTWTNGLVCALAVTESFTPNEPTLEGWACSPTCRIRGKRLRKAKWLPEANLSPASCCFITLQHYSQQITWVDEASDQNSLASRTVHLGVPPAKQPHLPPRTPSPTSLCCIALFCSFPLKTVNKI